MIQLKGVHNLIVKSAVRTHSISDYVENVC